MKRRLARAVCVLVAGLTLATVSACGDDTPPPTTTSTPPATEAPESPTPTADPVGQLPDFTKWQDEPADIPVPELPEAATKKTKAGAIAFAKHYLDLFNYAFLTGDAAPAKRASPHCDACKESVENLAVVLASGGRYRGDPRYFYDGVEMVQFTDTYHAVAIRTHVGPRRVQSPDAGRFNLKAKKQVMSFSLVFGETKGWLVDDLHVSSAE